MASFCWEIKLAQQGQWVYRIVNIMDNGVLGLHHITAISGNAQQNLDFYSGRLGLRLVKRSVNQDDPSVYHLFYADGAGSPGTDLTFFPWDKMAPKKEGVGTAPEMSFAIPQGALPYWQERLHDLSPVLEERFGEQNLVFSDPHGFKLSLAEISTSRDFTVWEKSPVPAEYQIMGLHAVRLLVRHLAPTENFLTHILGLHKVATDSDWHRFGVHGSGSLVDVRQDSIQPRGHWGIGAIHHVAFRVKDSEHEMALRERILAAGARPSGQIDRFWFKSVYFLEPAGVLYELATDEPGFGVDEDINHLGESLILPPWLEPQRDSIEHNLPPLRYPESFG